MLIVGNNNGNGYFRLSPDRNAATPRIPAFSIPQKLYNQLFVATQLGSDLTLQVQDTTMPTSQFRCSHPQLVSLSDVEVF